MLWTLLFWLIWLVGFVVTSGAVAISGYIAISPQRRQQALAIYGASKSFVKMKQQKSATEAKVWESRIDPNAPRQKRCARKKADTQRRVDAECRPQSLYPLVPSSARFSLLCTACSGAVYGGKSVYAACVPELYVGS